MKDRWNYSGLGQVQYGIETTYELAAEWLDVPGWTVEDWGCGCAHARRYFHHSKYIGIDGSQNDYADLCRIDLCNRDSKPEGILLRHVLDHNESWRKLLENALKCFQRRMVLVFFIPFGEETRVINRTNDTRYPGVPDIQFRRQDIMDEIGNLYLRSESVQTDTLIYCEKPTS